MGKPLKNCTIAEPGSPGWFGARRKFDVHTGIDCYCDQYDIVYAIEDGVVTNVCQFTGEALGFGWWNDTDCVSVEGVSGVILYGELSPFVKIGQVIKEGDEIGKILRVLKNDKGKPMDMLHLELYEHGYRGNWEAWELTDEQPKSLRDPSILLNL